MGGPPVRGDYLPIWAPTEPISEADRARWLAAAERIAMGIVTLAHLDAFVDAESLRVGFSCDGDPALAAAYIKSIADENVGALQVAPIVTGQPERPADEVILPCHPDTTDEEIRHAVLATLKASHALEFDLTVEMNEALNEDAPRRFA